MFFDENEAFIALTSVTSFVHLLLKQIQERIAYLKQQEKLATQKEFTYKIEIIAAEDKSPVDKLIDLIVEFSNQNYQSIFSNTKNIREVEIMGLFQAYIESAGKNIKVQREPKINDLLMGVRPDFIIEIDGQKIILEFNRSVKNSPDSRTAMNQILSYLAMTNINKGIIYYANFNEPNPLPNFYRIETTQNDKAIEITTITT